MPVISNFQDFNLPTQINEVQTTEGQNNRLMAEVVKGYSSTISSAINTVPNIMSEQRNNFTMMFDILDRMEEKGMIKITRPQAKEEDGGIVDFLIGIATIIGGIILIGLMF